MVFLIEDRKELIWKLSFHPGTKMKLEQLAKRYEHTKLRVLSYK